MRTFGAVTGIGIKKLALFRQRWRLAYCAEIHLDRPRSLCGATKFGAIFGCGSRPLCDLCLVSAVNVVSILKPLQECPPLVKGLLVLVLRVGVVN